MAEHWRELQASAISYETAALNFRSFGPGTGRSAEAERQALIRHAAELLNPQPGHAFQGLLKLNTTYRHFDHGGWRFIGDALPGFDATSCWKPNQPRYSQGFGSKPIKYETTPKRRPGLFLPQVAMEQWGRIAAAYGLATPSDTSQGFWAWALSEPNLPLVVVEGAKKACALMSHGIAAIGLSGVWMGRIVERDGLQRRTGERLIAQLQALAPGRAFTICFDADPKPSTAQTVELAAVRLGHCLAKAGAEVAIATVPLIKGAKTGPDDYLLAHGEHGLQAVLEAACSLAEHGWRRRYVQERRMAGRTICSRSLDALLLPSAAVIGVRSAKGTGKTQALGRWLQHQPQVLAITHRRSLGAAMASRLGLVWWNHLDAFDGQRFDEDGRRWNGAPPRLAICIDSLLALPPSALEGAVVVLDEAEQVLAHLLTSATCTNHRGLLIQKLVEAIGAASQVIALDADLSDATLKWVRQARRLHQADDAMELVANVQAPQQWKVYWYEQAKPAAFQAALLDAVGKAPQFVVVDSKRKAEALHHLLQHHFPNAKGLLITSTTTATADGAQACAALTSAEALTGVQWAIASPSISSGLSIEHHHFHGVWGLFGAGSFDDSDALQALARVRQPVERHVWTAPVVLPKQRPISSAFWPMQVEGELRQRWNDQAARLRQTLQPDLLTAPAGGGELFSMAMEQWAIVQSRRNYSLAHLRAFIRARLLHEGHLLVANAAALEPSIAAAMEGLQTDLRDKRERANAQAIAAAPAINQQQAEDLERRQFLLPEQQAALERRAICERLALPPQELTPAMVQWSHQWAGAARRLAMLLSPQMALELDAKRAAASSGGGLLPFDQTFHAQTIAAAEAIGLRAFVLDFAMAMKQWDNTTPEVVELADKARKYSMELRQIFGLAISPLPYVPAANGSKAQGDSSVAIVGKLLKLFGLTTTATRSFKGARSYGLEQQQLGLVMEAAERLQRKQFGHTTSPDGAYISSRGGMDPAMTTPVPTFHDQARQVRDLVPCPDSASSPPRAASV